MDHFLSAHLRIFISLDILNTREFEHISGLRIEEWSDS